jgi:hypothetical protein
VTTTKISGAIDNSVFVVDGPLEIDGLKVGTSVEISNPREFSHRLLAETAPISLVIQLALYLIKFRDISISYDGLSLDPASIIERQVDLEVVIDEDDCAGYGRPQLRIIEWDKEAKAIKPSLILCTEDGAALEELSNDMDTRLGIPYTGYLSWPGFAKYAHELMLANLGHEVLGPIVQSARDAISQYIDSRLGERRSEQIVKWKTEGIYPYREEPSGESEIQERKVFDLLATSAASSLAKEKKAARFSLRLLREAIAQPPEALHRVLQEVLGLTPEQVSELAQLLERTTLASMIHATRLVVDRLDFVDDLESLLFDVDKRPKLMERAQLHRILENGRGWVFGEEYSLAVSDRGLTAVLEAHLSLLGSDVGVDTPVTDPNNQQRRLDLMYSKALRQSNQRQHLVVELKRPSINLSMGELAQISNYADAVMADSRFDSPDVRWVFWLIGDAMDDAVERVINSSDRPSGMYLRGTNYEVWVKTWAEAIEENRQRLHFYREHLEYRAQDNEALDEMLTKYLPATDYRENVEV